MPEGFADATNYPIRKRFTDRYSAYRCIPNSRTNRFIGFRRFFRNGDRIEMKRFYCTYFDSNYLVKALALIESLNTHERKPFHLFAVCQDELSRIVLFATIAKE